MERYYGEGEQTPSTAGDTIAALITATTVRPRIYRIELAYAGTPEDTYSLLRVNRSTADGTGTSFTPVSLDPGGVAAKATFKSDYTAEPTYTANAYLLKIVMNSRSTYRWTAEEGGEIIVPATAANGVGLQTVTTTATIDAHAYFHWIE